MALSKELRSQVGLMDSFSQVWLVQYQLSDMEHFERFPIEKEQEYVEDDFVEHILAMYQDPQAINYIDPFVDDIQVTEHDSKHQVLVHHVRHNKDSNVVQLSIRPNVLHQNNDCKIH